MTDPFTAHEMLSYAGDYAQLFRDSVFGAYVFDKGMDRAAEMWKDYKASGQKDELQSLYTAQSEQLTDMVQNNDIFQSAPAEHKQQWLEDTFQKQMRETEQKLDELKAQDAKAFELMLQEQDKLEQQQHAERERLAEAARADLAAETALKEEQAATRKVVEDNLAKQGLEQQEIEARLAEQKKAFDEQRQAQQAEALKNYQAALEVPTRMDRAHSYFER